MNKLEVLKLIVGLCVFLSISFTLLSLPLIIYTRKANGFFSRLLIAFSIILALLYWWTINIENKSPYLPIKAQLYSSIPLVTLLLNVALIASMLTFKIQVNHEVIRPKFIIFCIICGVGTGLLFAATFF